MKNGDFFGELISSIRDLSMNGIYKCTFAKRIIEVIDYKKEHNNTCYYIEIVSDVEYAIPTDELMGISEEGLQEYFKKFDAKDLVLYSHWRYKTERFFEIMEETL
jgi:hypothetical protein